MRQSLAFAIVLAACDGSSPTGTPDAAAPDATAPDGPPDLSLIPLTIIGSTPNGPFDVHYIGVAYTGGDCPPAYTIAAYETNEVGTAPVFVVTLREENVTAPTGTLSAVAMTWNNASTETPVAFEATHVDLPPTNPLRLAGRAVVNASPWQFDFSLDVLIMPAYCI